MQARAGLPEASLADGKGLPCRKGALGKHDGAAAGLDLHDGAEAALEIPGSSSSPECCSSDPWDSAASRDRSSRTSPTNPPASCHTQRMRYSRAVHSSSGISRKFTSSRSASRSRARASCMVNCSRAVR
ncbi:unnamed protein product [Prorocentrum cordatum]|uniref:Uncharacterized protein n=1 Tax=Prorocentrum cordatum TaxID=2364126 RepID=A0ABN9W8G6_9DINO|nr:unnamed protein product [Polarella glacialis]